MIDVSVVINLHREGRVCEGTIESVLRAVDIGKASGISSEIICVVDNGDRDTLRCLERYFRFVTIYECHFADLSKARNYGLSKSCGTYVTFIDGDDLWGDEWVARCVGIMIARQNAKLILHPQLNLYFGNDLPSSFWVHPDAGANEVDLLDVFIANRWTALCFARREVFAEFPYVDNQIEEGYGYEDWLWHIQTTLAGFEHALCPKTCHFVRRKGTGSLLTQTNLSRSIPNINAIDDIGKLRRSIFQLVADK